MGMLGSDDFVDNARPEDWTQRLFREFPNGSPNGGIPLTGMISMMGKRSTVDPKYHWFEKELPLQAGSFTAGEIYTDASMATPVADDASLRGEVLYLKVTEQIASEFREGMMAILMTTLDDRGMTRFRVLKADENGTNSRLKLKLMHADTSDALFSIRTADFIQSASDINPEGSPPPSAIKYSPIEYWNYTAIHRTSIEETRTAKATKLRTEDNYNEAKREAIELHEIGKEWRALTSYRDIVPGPNGKPMRTEMGLYQFLSENRPANIDNYTRNTAADLLAHPGRSDFSGKNWIQGGRNWLNEFLSTFFVYGRQERVVLCGNLVMKAIEDLAIAYGEITLTVGQHDFGLRTMDWVTNSGILHFKQHPLFSRLAPYQRTAIIFDPANARIANVEGGETMFRQNILEGQGGYQDIDGTMEGFLDESSIMWIHNRQWAWLSGFGLDN